VTINCHDIEQFIQIIAGLAQRGIGFKADANRLVITLTGAC
jgi:hypothetical protein